MNVEQDALCGIGVGPADAEWGSVIEQTSSNEATGNGQ